MPEWFSLKGRVALVTGASRGIGRSIALALGAAGADVACCARSEAQVAATADEVRDRGVRTEGFRLDVTQPAAIESVVREVETTLGAVDILVNNAGITLEKKSVEVTDEEWERV